jgi:hypothetical protein
MQSILSPLRMYGVVLILTTLPSKISQTLSTLPSYNDSGFLFGRYRVQISAQRATILSEVFSVVSLKPYKTVPYLQLGYGCLFPPRFKFIIH